jgi:nucleotide-binding universal stress UspA family protein
MYKHILLAVDGSNFGMGSIPHAIKLAKAIGARITAIHVTTPYASIAIGEVAAHVREADYDQRVTAAAATLLGNVKAAATEAGVPISAYHVPNVHPWEAIIGLAKETGCDLIFMASHGRRGVAGLLIGSETKKVLTHSSIPVLVWRA